jgi:murein L,D-transpeptidase YcbB/YkuD
MTGPSAAPGQSSHLAPANLPPFQAALASATGNSPELGTFYAARDYRPLWVAPDKPLPAAYRVLDMLRDAASDGLDPAQYHVAELAPALAGKPTPALELALSQNYVAFVRDLRRPAPADRFAYVDEQLIPELRASAILAAAPARPMHPIYQGLRRALAAPGLTPAQAAQIRINLDRARALPADGRRHIIVDTASARLWMYEGNRVVDTMRVVVGKPRLQTPMLAGLIRFATLDPYWNLPPDLIRERARHVVQGGVEVLARERLELLSDWGPAPRVLDPLEVDWPAVAAGSQSLRMRQLPGPDNMMGNIKFMLPNQLGIYLHDTPLKGDFARDDRRLSSGCVRVEDAQRLARWLYGGTAPTPDGTLEQRVNLPETVPVYIGYFTALPTPAGFAFQPDRYGRDRQIAALMSPRAGAAAPSTPRRT